MNISIGKLELDLFFSYSMIFVSCCYQIMCGCALELGFANVCVCVCV